MFISFWTLSPYKLVFKNEFYSLICISETLESNKLRFGFYEIKSDDGFSNN